MGKYEFWRSDEENAQTFTMEENVEEMKAKGLLDGFRRILVIEADDWVEANQKFHESQGFEEYKPMPEDIVREKLVPMTLEKRLWYAGQRKKYENAIKAGNKEALREILSSVFLDTDEIEKIIQEI